MRSQPEQEAITIHILTNISRSKGNQAMILGQQIESNMRNIFFDFEKSCTKCDGETTLRPFSKPSKLSISRDKYTKVSYSLFLWYAKLWIIRTY